MSMRRAAFFSAASEETDGVMGNRANLLRQLKQPSRFRFGLSSAVIPECDADVGCVGWVDRSVE